VYMSCPRGIRYAIDVDMDLRFTAAN
jgi:hypothetical protein